MGLSKLSEKDLIKENESLDWIYKYCNLKTSFIFNAGAGSGKTYALIQCLEYIISNYRKELLSRNQKVSCITYTNVAANNIKKRIGLSDIIEVSTIHECLWKLISNQQTALLEIHIEKIEKELDNINQELAINSDFEKYRNLSTEKKQNLLEIMIKNKKIYNRVYGLKAKDFRNEMPKEILSEYPELISNVSKFRKLIDKIYKKESYNKCLERIKQHDSNYKKIYYDARYNRDRLEKMRISHETLLEYSGILIERFPRMRQIIIDYYPFILIDEYQDTEKDVIKIMAILDVYAKKIKHDFLVGYFGDAAQNIYDKGIGAEIAEIHQGLEKVYKEYNRRSYSEIIDTANRVRNDGLIQKSIFSDSTGGSVQCYQGNKESINGFIRICSESWKVSGDNPLHCMFSTNQLVAKYSGFIGVYEAFKNTDIYTGVGYEQLNTELLSPDTEKLGKIQMMLYKFLTIYVGIRDPKKPLRKIFPTDKYRIMSIKELRILSESLLKIDDTSLNGLLKKIFNEYTSTTQGMFKYIIETIFDIGESTLSYNSVINYFCNTLYKKWDENKGAEEMISNILNLKKEELLNWYHYIKRDVGKKIQYHTIHSTKGLEYENVVIILEKDFGREKKLFENFFKYYNKEEILDIENFIRGRNMLYVAVTRAIKNLKILYIDDISSIKENLERIFNAAIIEL